MMNVPFIGCKSFLQQKKVFLTCNVENLKNVRNKIVKFGRTLDDVGLLRVVSSEDSMYSNKSRPSRRGNIKIQSYKLSPLNEEVLFSSIPKKEPGAQGYFPFNNSIQHLSTLSPEL